MNNAPKVSISADGKTLVIELPINADLPESKSGKTLLVASTGGFVKTNARMASEDGTVEVISINVTATVPNN